MLIKTNKRFDDARYRNWIKICRACETLHSSLRLFVERQSEELWYDVITTWIKSHGRCQQCRASDVTFNARRVPKIKCWSLPCPNNVCNKWVAEIARNHAYAHTDSIRFTNCDVTRWPSNSWEFAKAFMSEIGDNGRQSSEHVAERSPINGSSKLDKHPPSSSHVVAEQQSMTNAGNSRPENQSNRVQIGGRTLIVGKRRTVVTKVAKTPRQDSSAKTTVDGEAAAASNRASTQCKVQGSGGMTSTAAAAPTPTETVQPSDDDVRGDHVNKITDYCGDVTLQHLLSFLVNCSTLHTSFRKSRDQQGGLTARHVIRIKKVHVYLS